MLYLVGNGCIPLLTRNKNLKLFDTGKVTTMEKTLEDIGIYTDIHESGNIVSDRHKMYYATCKVCRTVVEKRLADIKESNKVCRHQVLDKTSIGGILIILKKPVKYLKKMHQNQFDLRI